MRAVEHPVDAEEVMAYLDGELAGARGTVVHGHLATCERCRDIASRLRRLSTELSEWQVADVRAFAPPEGLVTESPRRNPWWRRRRVWQFAAAAAVLTLFTARLALVNYPTANHRVGTPTEQEVNNAELASARASLAASPLQATESLPRRQIVRTASLTLIVTDFAVVRPAVDRVLQEVGGFLGQVQVNNFEDGAQRMTAVLRVPASRLDEAIRALKGLGHATTESQSGDDVGEEVTDLDARLANARSAEARLVDLMRNRTGNVSQVLEVEREIARVRGEIERMVGRREELEKRITYATLTLNVSVQRQASLSTGPVPVATELRNAFVEGLRYAYESARLVAAVLLSALPVLLLWTVVLWVPVRALLRARRARRT
jgi:anti-sigma factor RsiW